MDSLSNRYAKSCDLLRKLEAADRDAQRQSGDLIPAEQVQRDAAICAQMFKQMRESMARRVVELLPELAPELKPRVAAAIERVRAHEDKVFARLDTIADEAEFNELLTAAV